MNRYNGNSGSGSSRCTAGFVRYGTADVYNTRCGCASARGDDVNDNGSCGCHDHDDHDHDHDHDHDNCGCGTNAESRYGIDGRPVGSVYAPLQNFEGLYDTCRGLSRGTIFSALDLPLMSACGGSGRGCGCGCGCGDNGVFDGIGSGVRTADYQNGGHRHG
ncbi:MAG: spore coat associated protein CotJA [Clostridia bacterium]|nr:spore coat associated protein CotJA [Clostridia bacterium]